MTTNLATKWLYAVLAVLIVTTGMAQKTGKKYSAIYSGVPWFDDRGKVVSAHGANIIKDNDRYFLFGEAHSDTSNAFAGFNCYSSSDLCNWKFEAVALPVQRSGKLGPNRIGERPKVMKCPSTGEYIMFMHVDTLGYIDQYVGYATSASIVGPYEFKGPLLFAGKPIRKWDMGTFQDHDGKGYVLIHGGEIYRLADDYKHVVEQVSKGIASGFESPAMMRKGNRYYFFGSHLTSWERNDNDYYTADSLKGPWTYRGTFAPRGSLTWNSQTTFILPIEGTKDTTYMFMGDRWSFPKQASAATYVWQPLTIFGTSVSIPAYQEAWQIDTAKGIALSYPVNGKVIDNTNSRLVTFSKPWVHSSDTVSVSGADTKDAMLTIKFSGEQVYMYGLACSNGGYARISILNRKGEPVLLGLVDMYCKYPVSILKFVSPKLPRGEYIFTLSPLEEHGNWSDKRKNIYGSTGNYIYFDKLTVK